MTTPDYTYTASGFGGGWVVPHSNEARDVLEHFYEEPPAPLQPLGGQVGYIVEPYQRQDLADYLRLYGLQEELA